MGGGVEHQSVAAARRRTELLGRQPDDFDAAGRGLVEHGEPVAHPLGEVIGDDEHVDVAPHVEVAASDRADQDDGVHGDGCAQRLRFGISASVICSAPAARKIFSSKDASAPPVWWAVARQ